jgi:Protein of unknown function (DUF2939)
MKSSFIKAAVATAAVAIGAYWYWSPVLTIRQMQSAAKAGDADAFNDHVDYPRLRDSVKGQFSTMLTKTMSSQPEPGNDFAKAGTALGTMLGLAMVDRFVDAMVRPEVVMRAMQEGKLVPKQAEPASASSATDPANQVKWTSERKGVDKYIAYVGRTGDADDKRVAMVLERTGFANWKLTEVRLPLGN